MHLFFNIMCPLWGKYRVQEHGGETIIPFSGVLEQKLVDMPEDEAAVYCQENQTIRYFLVYTVSLQLSF